VTPMVEVEALTRRFGDITALHGVGFVVPAGEIFGILGANGSGKTTLHRIISTLLAPTEGTARVLGADVRSQGAAVRRTIGVVFQEPSLDPLLTVRENLDCYGRLRGMNAETRQQRVRQVIALLKLDSLQNRLAKTISWGLKRRVEIGRGLLTEPRLLLLDEPCASLDPPGRHEMWEHLRHINQESGTTILLSTHHLDEAMLCHRAIVLNGGRVVAEGEPAALLQQSGEAPVTDAFLCLMQRTTPLMFPTTRI